MAWRIDERKKVSSMWGLQAWSRLWRGVKSFKACVLMECKNPMCESHFEEIQDKHTQTPTQKDHSSKEKRESSFTVLYFLSFFPPQIAPWEW